MTYSPAQREAISDAAQAELARGYLLDFCRRMSAGYEEAAHTLLLIEHLEALERREIQKLIVEMPPRHSKSYHFSERFPAWYLGRHPDHPVIISSYGAQLAERQSRRVRALVESERYPFPTGVSGQTRAVSLWETTAGGEVTATGVGGALTGFGAKLLIIDDPIKDREEADSEVIRQKVWDWYTDVARTRLMPDAAQLVGMTRWHEADLVGRLLDSDEGNEWTVLRLPALAEDDDPMGRGRGEALWPGWFDELYLEGMQRLLGSRSFVSLYQQRPTAEEGGMFKRAWFLERYSLTPLERATQEGRVLDTPWHVCLTVDSAWDKGVGHDYSVIAVWGTDLRNYYLLYVWRDRVEYPDLKRAVLDIHARQHPMRPFGVFVEDAANGRPLVQDLRRLNVPVVGVRPVGSKQSRAAAVTPWFESGAVLLPERADWLEDWIEEHIGFPNAAYDDQVDTTALALSQLTRRFAALPLGVELPGTGTSGTSDTGGMSERRRKLLAERARGRSAGAVQRAR
ncbi:MAG TPA: phage terminase large subunit [Gemmatimonadales bacterium]